MLDIFRANPAFRFIEMTDRVNKRPYVPSFLRDLGLFTGSGVPTTRVAIRRDTHTYMLVKAVPRSAPRNPIDTPERALIDLNIPHLPQTERIVPDEVQDVQSYGDNFTLASAEEVVNERLDIMATNDELTQEFHRVGAFLGQILDADGSVLLNEFTAFGITPEATIVDPLDVATTDTADLTLILHNMRREMSNNLAMGQTQIGLLIALVGDTFYDRLVSRADVREDMREGSALLETFGGDSMAPQDFMRHTWVYNSFIYKDVIWHNYRGINPSTGAPMIPADEAHFAPYMPGLFQARYGPRNNFDGVNQVGLPRYSDTYVDPRGEYIDIVYESNPLYYCARPELLMTWNLP
jgi:hypothetical protein